MLEITSVLMREGVKAVRPKTSTDARFAGLPHARAGHLALLLAASLDHGSGDTCHFLGLDGRHGAKLIEAGLSFSSSGRTENIDAEVVAPLEFEGLARRGYFHVEQWAALRAAQRLVEALLITTVPSTLDMTVQPSAVGSPVLA